MTRKSLKPVAVAAFVVLFGGCVTNRVTIQINPDGSGQIVVARLLNHVAVENVREWRGQAGKDKSQDPFFDMRMLRREVRMYGTGISLVEARRMDLDGGRGFIAVYSFRNIADVAIVPEVANVRTALCNPENDPFRNSGGDAGEDDEATGGGIEERGIEFGLQTGDVNRLRITLPWSDRKTKTGRHAIGDDDQERAKPNDTMAEDTVVRDRPSCFWPTAYSDDFWGDSFVGRRLKFESSEKWGRPIMTVRLDVVFVGKVVASTATHTNASNPNCVVLLDMDTTRGEARKCEDDCGCDMWGIPPALTMDWFGRFAGAVVESNREVVVEFK